jgi:hypothetical protein
MKVLEDIPLETKYDTWVEYAKAMIIWQRAELREKDALIVELTTDVGYYGSRVIACESQMSFEQLENSRKYMENNVTGK